MKAFPWIVVGVLVTGFNLKAADSPPAQEDSTRTEREKEKDGKARASNGAPNQNVGNINTPGGTASQGNSDKRSDHQPGTTHDSNTSGGKDGTTQGGNTAPSGK